MNEPFNIIEHPTKPHYKTIRFSDELYNKLEQLSKKHNVSFNDLIDQMCNYAIKSMK